MQSKFVTELIVAKCNVIFLAAVQKWLKAKTTFETNIGNTSVAKLG